MDVGLAAACDSPYSSRCLVKVGRAALAACVLVVTPAMAQSDINGYDCSQAGQVSWIRTQYAAWKSASDRQIVEEYARVNNFSLDTAALYLGCSPPEAKDVDAYNRCVITRSKPGARQAHDPFH